MSDKRIKHFLGEKKKENEESKQGLSLMVREMETAGSRLSNATYHYFL